MLTKKDCVDCISTVLTPSDLYMAVKGLAVITQDPDIILNYGKGHFLIGHKKYRNGLSVATDSAGVWEITELQSYELTERVTKTEITETVVRAVASLLNMWEESR